MTHKVRCPRCGSEADVESEVNPVRNVVRETINCRRCGYSAVKDHPPDVTLGDWIKK